MDLKPEEKRILQTLYFANKPLTTKSISERTNMAWQTTKNYLGQMHQRGLLNKGKKGSSIYWWIRI
ncbi:helix-turn-helix domain-containing protein [Methanolapillus millepedarum]|uniref:helix-turn-helix domain-containing protein n=1 Tax=Methanolapillus millepedarum TaxID=3028296 RepID=UPI0030B914BF